MPIQDFERYQARLGPVPLLSSGDLELDEHALGARLEAQPAISSAGSFK